MNIKNKILDIILENSLVKLAFKRKFALDKIHEQAMGGINYEMLKILLYQNSKNQKHWRDKLKGYLIKVQKYKNIKQGQITSNDYFNILFDGPLGEIKQLEEEINIIENEYYKPSYFVTSPKKLHSYLKKIYIKLSKDLSMGTFKDINSYIPDFSKDKIYFK